MLLPNKLHVYELKGEVSLTVIKYSNLRGSSLITVPDMSSNFDICYV